MNTINTNPYLDEFRAAKGSSPQSRSIQGMMRRDELCQKYSWAVPTPEVIGWIVDQAIDNGFFSLVEIGAGNGYWSDLLHNNAGLEMTCYDLDVPTDGNNTYHAPGRMYHTVHQGGTEKAALHPDDALFLCWPPYEDSMGHDALKAYTGEWFFYIGETRDGCTADKQFFDLLEAEWTLVASCPSHVSWIGASDEVRFYRRTK